MFNILKNLINKKFYTTKEEAQAKVDMCFAMGKLTQDQYAELTMLIEEKYQDEDEPTEEVEA